MTTDRIRVGVIGTGNMGANHARVYSMLRSVDLVGVAEPRPEQRDVIAGAFNARAFHDYRDLLPHVDAVSVAVPTPLHREIAGNCLRERKHVLVEKPLAASVEEGVELLALAKENGAVLQVGHIERFNPAVQILEQILKRDRILAISTRRLSPPTPHIQDVDVIFDLLIHDLDVAMWLTSSPVRSVTAMGNAVGGGDLDLVIAHIGFENGVLADLVASKVTHSRVRELEITAERGYVTVDYLTRSVSVHRRTTVSAVEGTALEYRQEAFIERPVVRSAEPLYLELEHFIQCVAGAAPVVHPEEALEALRVAATVRESIHRHSPAGALASG